VCSSDLVDRAEEERGLTVAQQRLGSRARHAPAPKRNDARARHVAAVHTSVSTLELRARLAASSVETAVWTAATCRARASFRFGGGA